MMLEALLLLLEVQTATTTLKWVSHTAWFYFAKNGVANHGHWIYHTAPAHGILFMPKSLNIERLIFNSKPWI
jgi:hypothetical protein